MTARTTTERVAALRERRAKEGISELRGVFAPTDQHAAIKDAIKELLNVHHIRRQSSQEPEAQTRSGEF